MPPETDTLVIYTEHRLELVNYANRIVGDRAHAEDVVQEAYLRFDAAAQNQTLIEPLAYLFRIVRNLALDFHRKIKRDQIRTVANGDDVIESLVLDKPSPEIQARDRQELDLMIQAVAELPERTRIAFEMHRLGDRTFKEISQHLSISVGLAHALVIQALEHCRERLYRNKV